MQMKYKFIQEENFKNPSRNKFKKTPILIKRETNIINKESPDKSTSKIKNANIDQNFINDDKIYAIKSLYKPNPNAISQVNLLKTFDNTSRNLKNYNFISSSRKDMGNDINHFNISTFNYNSNKDIHPLQISNEQSISYIINTDPNKIKITKQTKDNIKHLKLVNLTLKDFFSYKPTQITEKNIVYKLNKNENLLNKGKKKLVIGSSSPVKCYVNDIKFNYIYTKEMILPKIDLLNTLQFKKLNKQNRNQI